MQKTLRYLSWAVFPEFLAIPNLIQASCLPGNRHSIWSEKILPFLKYISRHLSWLLSLSFRLAHAVVSMSGRPNPQQELHVCACCLSVHSLQQRTLGEERAICAHVHHTLLQYVIISWSFLFIKKRHSGACFCYRKIIKTNTQGIGYYWFFSWFFSCKIAFWNGLFLLHHSSIYILN